MALLRLSRSGLESKFVWVLEADFVTGARALGASRFHILLRHIVPNVLGPVAIQVGTVAAGVVLSESALSFVGLGPSDGVSLGVPIEQGAAGMLHARHVLLASATALALASGACQMAAQGLRQWGSSNLSSRLDART